MSIPTTNTRTVMDSREYRFNSNVSKDEGEDAIASLTFITLDGDTKPISLFPTYDDLTELRIIIDRQISAINSLEGISV